MANNQYSSNYGSFAPADVHEVDMDRRADWAETDTNDPSYILNKPDDIVNVQPDWNQTNTGKLDYIKNKPTIPSVPSAPAKAESDKLYVLKVSSGGSVTWDEYTPASSGTE